MNDDPIILSEEGRLRQRQILAAAMRESRDRKRRVAIIRAAWLSGAFVLMGLILWPVVYSRISTPPTHDGLSIIHVVPRTAPAPLVVVKRIETDPNILQRLALPPIQSTIRHINEDELLRELADAHRPAGIVSVNGKSQLIFR